MPIKTRKRTLDKVAARLGYRVEPQGRMHVRAGWRLLQRDELIGDQHSESLPTLDAVAARLEDLEIVRRAKSRVEMLTKELAQAQARVDEIKELIRSYAPLIQLERNAGASLTSWPSPFDPH